ncbi:MAG: hypothetical protein ACI4QM_01900, partial [Alphaproteobacteria bacterium]
WQVKTITVGGVTERWYVAQQNMSWWDAESACKAAGLTMVTVNELVNGWSGSSGTFTRTERAQKLYDAFGGAPCVWTSDDYNSCYPFYVDLSYGNVNYHSRYLTNLLALCH